MAVVLVLRLIDMILSSLILSAASGPRSGHFYLVFDLTSRAASPNAFVFGAPPVSFSQFFRIIRSPQAIQ
jgi:hypothetical protein